MKTKGIIPNYQVEIILVLFVLLAMILFIYELMISLKRYAFSI